MVPSGLGDALSGFRLFKVSGLKRVQGSPAVTAMIISSLGILHPKFSSLNTYTINPVFSRLSLCRQQVASIQAFSVSPLLGGQNELQAQVPC